MTSTSNNCPSRKEDSNSKDFSLPDGVKGSTFSHLKEKQQVEEMSSIHAGHVVDIHQVPMKVIVRPIPSILDENKVESLMETIKVKKRVKKNKKKKNWKQKWNIFLT